MCHLTYCQPIKVNITEEYAYSILIDRNYVLICKGQSSILVLANKGFCGKRYMKLLYIDYTILSYQILRLLDTHYSLLCKTEPSTVFLYPNSAMELPNMAALVFLLT